MGYRFPVPVPLPLVAAEKYYGNMFRQILDSTLMFWFRNQSINFIYAHFRLWFRYKNLIALERKQSKLLLCCFFIAHWNWFRNRKLLECNRTELLQIVYRVSASHALPCHSTMFTCSALLYCYCYCYFYFNATLPAKYATHFFQFLCFQLSVSKQQVGQGGRHKQWGRVAVSRVFFSSL